MTTTALSVVQYSNNKTSPQKLNNILQQSTIVNNNADRIIIVRKPQPILPATKEILLTNKAKKQRLERSKECIKPSASSAPVAVARRNARERNRVKQVNNGFATLRQHIPDDIAAAYESGSGRSGNKKLSKVETLRMAVEYIRSLEDILASDDCDSSLVSSYASSSPSSPTVTTTSAGGTTYTYPLVLSPCQEDDDLFSITSTPPPSIQQQYIRIPGTNAYQIIDPNLYEDSENLEPLDMEMVDSDLMGTDLGPDLLNSIGTVDGSVSPSDIYSDESLSPLSSARIGSVQDKRENLMFIPLFNARDLVSSEEIKFRISPAVTTTNSMNGTTDTTIVKFSSPLVSSTINKKDETMNPQLLSIKMEEQEQVIDEESKENNMIQVMAWWQEQQEQEAQTRS